MMMRNALKGKPLFERIHKNSIKLNQSGKFVGFSSVDNCVKKNTKKTLETDFKHSPYLVLVNNEHPVFNINMSDIAVSFLVS